MLIIPIKEGENIEKALKKYKKKFEKTNVMKQLRSRKQFEKPSIVRRQEVIKAAYKQRMQSEQL
jgi:small subunit ribosomal protein S21